MGDVMEKQSWVSLYGAVQIQDGTITFMPSVAVADDMPSIEGDSAQFQHATVRSNQEFEQGTIEWEAKLYGRECRNMLLLQADGAGIGASASSRAELSVGLNILGSPYGIAFWTGAVWEDLGGVGHGSTLPLGEWIPLKVTVRGSTIELYVQGIKVLVVNRVLRRGQIGAFLRGESGCAIRNLVVTDHSPTCFVIMQFTDEFDILFKDVIRPVCESYGYRVVRGDDFYTSGQIMEDVTQSIQSATLIIADVTPNNPNVFYELGFAHAIGKPTILLSDKKRDRLPFDISGFRALFYDNTIGGKAVVETRLKQHLDALRSK